MKTLERNFLQMEKLQMSVFDNICLRTSSIFSTNFQKIANRFVKRSASKRRYDRAASNEDCIYTIETPEGLKSFNACTYDLSKKGVSIILPEIAIAENMSILIFLKSLNIRAQLKFIRCDVFQDVYKLAFEFADMTDNESKKLDIV